MDAILDTKVSVTCIACHKTYEVAVNGADYEAWKKNGKHIQDAMPYLSVDDRESLLSGTCVPCWDKMFQE